MVVALVQQQESDHQPRGHGHEQDEEVARHQVVVGDEVEAEALGQEGVDLGQEPAHQHAEQERDGDHPGQQRVARDGAGVDGAEGAEHLTGAHQRTPSLRTMKRRKARRTSHVSRAIQSAEESSA